MSHKIIKAHFICGGKYHDMQFARLQILQLLYENEKIYTTFAADYSDIEALEAADFLVTYTCDVVPSDTEIQALQRFLKNGKRWLALHATNSVIEFLEDGRVGAPRTAPALMEMLGSQFLAHPPIQEFDVSVCEPRHPLVADIDTFTVNDELYLSEFHGECIPLLETRWTGSIPEFVDSDWQQDQPRLVMYLHPYDAGQVLYLTLGHCRRTYDMQPLVEAYPERESGSWDNPIMYQLIRRSIGWAIEDIRD